MNLLTRAEIRDAVRRLVGLIPPIDPQPATNAPVPGAVVGQVPPAFPDPSNVMLDQCLEFVLSDLNLTLNFRVEHSTLTALPAMPADFTGIQWLPMTTLPTFDGAGDTILGVTYSSQVARIVRVLTPVTRSDWQRNRSDTLYPLAVASIPNHYIVEGYELGVV